MWALAGLQTERGHSPEEEHSLLKSQKEGDKKGEQRREAGPGMQGRARAQGRGKARLGSERCFPQGAARRPPGRCPLAA